MSAARRLSICYLVPGHDLLSTVGPSRNVVNLARALSEWADVTVAFRRVADEKPPEKIRVLEIQPSQGAAGHDDAATRGVGYAEFYSYVQTLRRFAERELKPFDVVLEKSWLLSGYVSAICRKRGQLGVPIENIVVNAKHAAGTSFMKFLRLKAGNWIAGRALRGAPLIIAETPFLKEEIVKYWGVRPAQVEVVDLGVDRNLFKPVDQTVAREALKLPTDRTLLVYIGVLDLTHNIEPVIRALGAEKPAGVELHVVGDGYRRDEYAAIAREVGAPVIFHGRVPHSQVPTYIGAADLCIAPYDPSAFASGELGYSTMKIPEYLAVGRAVVSVPSGRIRTLIKEGENGFLFNNAESDWRRFFSGKLPARDRLREMSAAAARTPLASWQDTARGYLTLCEKQLATARHRG
jgi:glycosyltransferase involved in cell wall biosynthesis